MAKLLLLSHCNRSRREAACNRPTRSLPAVYCSTSIARPVSNAAKRSSPPRTFNSCSRIVATILLVTANRTTGSPVVSNVLMAAATSRASTGLLLISFLKSFRRSVADSDANTLSISSAKRAYCAASSGSRTPAAYLPKQLRRWGVYVCQMDDAVPGIFLNVF